MQRKKNKKNAVSTAEKNRVVHVGDCNLSDSEYVRISEKTVVVLGID